MFSKKSVEVMVVKHDILQLNMFTLFIIKYNVTLPNKVREIRPKVMVMLLE